jgi:hypothetical protein
MSFQSACESWEAAQHAQVIFYTWGHLDPKCGAIYKGDFTFIKGGYGAVDGQPCTSNFDFPGGPGFYDSMNDYIFKQCFNGGPWGKKPDGLYKWAGELKAFKNGRMRFQKGQLELLHRI